MSDDDLLRPTLSGYERVPELYNSTGFFMSSFFGGPLGAAIYGGANSHRLGRLAKDVSVLAALVVAAFLLPYVLHEAGLLQGLAASLGGRVANTYELMLRALGLATYGAIYLMHRRFFRAARVSGAREIPGWGPGIVAVVAGFAANAGFVSWILEQN